MVWQIILYESSRKERPVEKFIESLEKGVSVKVARVLDLLEVYGNLRVKNKGNRRNTDPIFLWQKGKDLSSTRI